MKKILKIAFALLVTLQINNVNAQDVKSQSEYIKDLKPGKYTILASDYSYGSEMEITEVKVDKSSPSGNFSVYLEMFPNEEQESKRRSEVFYRDNLVFPASYAQRSYMGLEKATKNAGIKVLRKIRSDDDRLIVLDKYIFLIQDWKSKDNYYGVTVLERGKSDTSKKGKKKKKKRRGFFGKLKTALKQIKAGSVEKFKKETLQPYLDKAFAKQAKEMKTPRYASLKKKQDALRDKVNKNDREFMHSYNDVTFHNNTGKTVYIYQGDSTRAGRIPNGTKVRYSCAGIFYYDYTGKRWYYPNSVILLHRADTKKCGKTVKIKK